MLLPNRRSIRLRNFDYATPGYYFVTICTADRACRFGRILDAEMHLSKVGRIVADVWLQMPLRCGVELDRWTIMPNHLHGLLGLSGQGSRMALSEVVRGFKTSSSRAVNKALGTLWQRGYYERVVRSNRELDNIREYVERNPGQWFEDEYHSEG